MSVLSGQIVDERAYQPSARLGRMPHCANISEAEMRPGRGKRSRGGAEVLASRGCEGLRAKVQTELA